LPIDPGIGTSINGLAEVYLSLNRMKKSEELFREAISFRKANLLSNDPVIGTSMNGLAKVL
jgi:hypothetical protein